MLLRHATATIIRIGPFLSDIDADTPLTALTLTGSSGVRLSKNGGTYAIKNDATTPAHAENGIYSCSLDALDTDTAGQLDIRVTATGALPYSSTADILSSVAWDSLFSSAAPTIPGTSTTISAASFQTTCAQVADAIIAADFALAAQRCAVAEAINAALDVQTGIGPFSTRRRESLTGLWAAIKSAQVAEAGAANISRLITTGTAHRSGRNYGC